MLQRQATATVAHLHSEIAGLSAGIPSDALVASSVHVVLAGRLGAPANGCLPEDVRGGPEASPGGRLIAIGPWALAPNSEAVSSLRTRDLATASRLLPAVSGSRALVAEC